VPDTVVHSGCIWRRQTRVNCSVVLHRCHPQQRHTCQLPEAKRSGVRALPHLCRRPVLAATKSCTRLGKETGAGASTTTTVLGTWAQLSGFELATTYEWWVQARSQYVVSDPSEVCTFTTP